MSDSEEKKPGRWTYTAEDAGDRVALVCKSPHDTLCTFLMTEDDAAGLVAALREARDRVREWRRENPDG